MRRLLAASGFARISGLLILTLAGSCSSGSRSQRSCLLLVAAAIYLEEARDRRAPARARRRAPAACASSCPFRWPSVLGCGERLADEPRPAVLELRVDPEAITTRTTLSALRAGRW